MRANESACVVLCKTSFVLQGATTAATSYDWTYPQVAATDEFVSMAQQFNLFKIRGMKFEIFHTNPTVSNRAAVSTVHASTTGALPSTWTTLEGVIDAPDSRFIIPGSEKQDLYWNASGSAEQEFQDVNTFTNHGGFRGYVDQTATVVQLATVVATAVVVFRGRH
jgi:hypothetical protein